MNNPPSLQDTNSYILKSISEVAERYMDSLEKRTAVNSRCNKRKVGAMLIDLRHNTHEGYNGPVINSFSCNKCVREGDDPGQNYYKCPAIHAEADVILSARRQDLSGSILYTTVFPCAYCVSLILRVSIRYLFYRHEHSPVETETLSRFLEYGGVVVGKV